MRCRERESASLHASLLGIEDNGNQQPSVSNAAAQSAPKLDTVMMRRQQIRTLRQEVSALSQQVKELTETQLLQESLDRLMNGPGASLTWKHAYLTERYRRRRAEAERDRLSDRIAASHQVLERVKTLLQAQENRLMPHLLPKRPVVPVSSPEDSLLFLHLRTNLDQRQQQLDSIFQNCQLRADIIKRRKSIINGGDQGFVIQAAGILPVDVATISHAMQQFILQHPHLNCSGENDRYFTRNLTATEAGEMFLDSDTAVRGMKYRSAFRPIVLQDRAALLWETVTDWDAGNETTGSQRRRLLMQGWAVTCPAEELGDGVSFVQSSVSVHVYASDGSETSILEPKTMVAIRSLEAYGRAQDRHIENIFIDYNAAKWK